MFKGIRKRKRSWAQETGPLQAELDIHLEGDEVVENSTNAAYLSEFIADISQATKEIIKDRLGKGRYSADLCITGVMPGSVRFVLSAPPLIDDQPPLLHPSNADSDALGLSGSVRFVLSAPPLIDDQPPLLHPSNADSDALRQISALLSHADDTQEDSPLNAEISMLPAKARKSLKEASDVITQAKWELTGSIAQRGYGISRIKLTQQGAKRLSDELSNPDPISRIEVYTGIITGVKDIEGIFWFRRDGNREFRATFPKDDTGKELRDKVVALLPNHPKVRAEFKVRETLIPGRNEIVRTSRTLISITLAPNHDVEIQQFNIGSI